MISKYAMRKRRQYKRGRNNMKLLALVLAALLIVGLAVQALAVGDQTDLAEEAVIEEPVIEEAPPAEPQPEPGAEAPAPEEEPEAVPPTLEDAEWDGAAVVDSQQLEEIQAEALEETAAEMPATEPQAGLQALSPPYDITATIDSVYTNTTSAAISKWFREVAGLSGITFDQHYPDIESLTVVTANGYGLNEFSGVQWIVEKLPNLKNLDLTGVTFASTVPGMHRFQTLLDNGTTVLLSNNATGHTETRKIWPAEYDVELYWSGNTTPDFNTTQFGPMGMRAATLQGHDLQQLVREIFEGEFEQNPPFFTEEDVTPPSGMELQKNSGAPG